jgi:hypothetical protein
VTTHTYPPCQRCGKAAMAHRDGRCPRRRGWIIAAAVVIIWVALWAGHHVYSAEMNKPYPPPACQLFGGSWNVWDGWSCQ